MKTNDIIKSLGMISPVTMPPSLVREIHTALVAGDEAAAQLETAVSHLASIIDDAIPETVPGGGHVYQVDGGCFASAARWLKGMEVES